ncbi:ATP-binding cassette domain-containing protein [Paenibacillus sp. H1-7]|uniref:ABC transporter transmembrane domain-containing protein n=1 Tax=Paenibacillus sp. H1-7 TaxID=2282849 RepID=UPI001EF86F76|nr:ABC transporter transmembrane domain-containing protein [Paenibacillus sp. H1-7]ULL18348.1 ATP-binding cassette domain-containing protein [Paenibacillus sp. H1-7]
MHSVRTLIRYVAPYKWLFGVFLLTIILEIIYSIAAPLSLKYLVDEAFAPKNIQAFVTILIVLLAGGTLSIAAGTYGDYTLSKLSGKVVQRLRTELFLHTQKQSMPFYQQFRIGDIITRFSSDMASIERVISGSLPLILKEALSVVLGLVMLCILEWKLTLAMVVGSVVMYVGPRLLQGRAEEANIHYREAQERFSNQIDETVKGHRTIKALHQQEAFLERARKQVEQLFRLGLNMHWINSLLERLPLTGLLLLNGIMIGFGGFLIFRDELTVGSFMAFFTLFLSVGQSASNLSFIVPNLIESGVSFRRIGEILDYRPDVPEAADSLELSSMSRDITMENVTFGYTEAAEQLKNVSLRIPAGSYAAFVGPSGSGKSTALQLLSRFYDPREGAVKMDGCDLRAVSEASLRRRTGIVFQDTFLFHATIRDNLLLDRTGDAVTKEQAMTDAARQAQIHDTILSWPDGYDTVILNEGASLSGGQRQRIAIARALLRDPELLLLDEVTSALDPASEADINRTIQELRRRKTIISVTHRLSSIVHADVIFVFRDGRIVESGTHSELLQQEGLYYEMWEKQHGFVLSPDGLHATVDEQRLGKLPFFSGIDPSHLRDMTSLFTTETFKDGEDAVREGEQGDKLYIIVRGRFEILKTTADAKEQRVAVLQDGDHFGEIALLRGIPRTATVRAMGPSVLLSVRRDVFLDLTRKHPHIYQTVERTLKERL